MMCDFKVEVDTRLSLLQYKMEVDYKVEDERKVKGDHKVRMTARWRTNAI